MSRGTTMLRRGVPTLVLLGFALAAAAWAEEAPTRPETVCLQCHGVQSGRLGEPVGLWRESVHAANAISCHDCHGGDPADPVNAMSPERGFLGVPQPQGIPAFCGRCHVGVQEDYLASAHGQALGRGGAQCVTCHGNHRVLAASPALINSRDCSRCHEYGRAEEIGRAVARVEERVRQFEERLAGLRRIGVAVKDPADRLFSLRNDFRRLFHSVEVERVKSETGRFDRRLDQLEQELAAIDTELRWRKTVGAALTALLVLAGVVLLLVRKTYEEEERNPAG